MAKYTITIKDFGECKCAGVFGNLKAVRQAIQAITAANLEHNEDALPDIANTLPDYPRLVKMFKDRGDGKTIESKEYYLENNSNNTKTLKITCHGSENVIAAW